MKIMTFNTQHCLNYLERKIDFEIMAEAIKTCGADVVGLNEMYNGGEEDFVQQTEKVAKAAGYEYTYFAEALVLVGKPYGNGLISKIPIVKAETIIIPDPVREEGRGYYETRCVLKAELENGVTVFVTHFGLVDTEQTNAVKTVLENLKTEKCVFMGDLNVTPENELLNPIRERMKDCADAFEKPCFSFPSDKPERKIDYIFVSPDAKVLSADIPAIVASDHRPHTAEIEF